MCILCFEPVLVEVEVGLSWIVFGLASELGGGLGAKGPKQSE